MVPAILSWTTILAGIVVAVFAPYHAMLLIIVFDLYWLLRITYLSIYLLQSWRQFRHDTHTDWYTFLKTSTDPAFTEWQEYWHMIFLPTYKEPISVLRETFESLRRCQYDHSRFIIVLAGEERDQAHFEKNAKILREEYGHFFGGFVVTLHPKDIVGEIGGKGSNLHNAGQEVKKYVDQNGIPYNRIIVSTFDCDTQPSPEYFAYLTKKYLETPDRERCSYQPVAIYHNNIWSSTPFTRVVSSSTTFWLLTELSRPERLLTFSSHSMSWQALVDVGFWQPDIVTEDTRIFLQAWLYYKGNYRTVPLFTWVSMSTVDEPGIWKTIVNQYKQVRRWGWGVEHMPYLLWHLLRDIEIPRWKRWRYIWNIGEGMYSWATVPIVILLMGYLPFVMAPYFGTPPFGGTVLAQVTPFILSWLMRLSMVGLLLSSSLFILLMPPRPAHVPRWHWIIFIAQWLFVPVSLIAFGSVPALEAQTRLAIGKYLGFWVAPKRTEKDLASTS